MKDYEIWLNDGEPAKNQSKFINQRLKIDDEIIGILVGMRNTTNNFGKTIHYILSTKEGELIFDSKSKKYANFFFSINLQSRVGIKKVIKNGRQQYEARLINTPEDELYSL
jgi:hypothetical protein